MTDHDPHEPRKEAGAPAQGKRAFEDLPPAAQRALREAEERRRLYDEREAGRPKEIGGRRKGREPGRYGDWEVKGIATDF